jgi:hypothetical protein
MADPRLVVFFHISSFFVVDHCWILIVKYYEMSIRRTKFVHLKNKWILSKRHILIPVVKKVVSEAKFTEEFPNHPKSGHCTLHTKPDCPTENSAVGRPRNDTHKNNWNYRTQVGRGCRSLVPILVYLCDCCRVNNGFYMFVQFWTQEHTFHSYAHIRTCKLTLLAI